MNQAVAAKPAAWALLLAFGIIYTAWGTTYYAIKLGVQREHLPPILFGGSRFVLAGVLLLGYQWLRRAPLGITAGEALRLLGISWLLFAGGNGLIGYGQRTVDSSVAAVLIATTPLLIGLCAACWPHGERLSPRGWAGLIVGLLGVNILLAPKLLAAEHTGNVLGFIMVLGSACSWALGSVILRHARPRQAHLTAAAYQMLLGGVSMIVLGLLIGEGSQLPDEVSTGAVLVFLYLLIVGSLGGFVAYNWLLGHVSAARAGTYAYVNPLVAVFIGWYVGEQVSWELWAGMAVILFGVYLIRSGEIRGGERSAPHASLPRTEPDQDQGKSLHSAVGSSGASWD